MKFTFCILEPFPSSSENLSLPKLFLYLAELSTSVWKWLWLRYYLEKSMAFQYFLLSYTLLYQEDLGEESSSLYYYSSSRVDFSSRM